MFICCELISSFASNCARSLMIRKWKLSGRFSRLSVTMSWPSYNLRSSTVPSKMVVYQWRADHILPQALNKLKWHGYWPSADFCFVVPSCHYARTWAWDGDKHGFSMLNFEWGFGHAENVSEFHAEAVNDEAEGKQEQCQSLINSFIWVMYSGAQWVCTARSNITRVLPGDHLSLSWCCLMQWQNLWPMETWQLHHDNAPSHLAQAFLAKPNIPLFCQALYSPDMAINDFFFNLPKLKIQLKGTQFESHEGIMQRVMVLLYYILKEAFLKCLEQWQDSW